MQGGRPPCQLKLTYFEGVLGDREWLIGDRCTYADLALFQVQEGLEYAFPNAFRHCAETAPACARLRMAVAHRPRVAAYLESPRRVPFNEHGIFRHYPELDAPARQRTRK